MIPVNLITDRTLADVQRVAALNAKPLDSWTEAEREEYIGDGGVIVTLSGVLYATDGVIYTPENPMKGAYNAADLNRVETAEEYVADYLNGLLDYLDAAGEEKGVAIDRNWIENPAVGDLAFKKNWENNVKPDPEELLRYVSNASAFRVMGLVGAGLPDSTEQLTYQQANAIEQLILDAYNTGREKQGYVERIIEIIPQSFVFSGEIFGGEVL